MSKKVFRREDLLSKEVINDKALKIGKVKELAYDEEGKLVLVIEKTNGGEEFFSMREVIAIGDVVLVGVKAPSPPTPTPMFKTCPSCGSANKPEALFCVKCGTKL